MAPAKSSLKPYLLRGYRYLSMASRRSKRSARLTNPPWGLQPERTTPKPCRGPTQAPGTGVARHYFCRICGVAPYYVPRSHPEAIDVNVRCLDGVDLAALVVTPFDGDRWEEHVEALRTRVDPGDP